MSQENRERYVICTRILNGEAPKVISSDYADVPYATILRYKRELEDAQANGTMAAFLEVDDAILEEITNDILSRTPNGLLSEVKAVTKELAGARGSLDMLSNQLIMTATIINARIQARAASIDHVSELEGLTDALCKLQNAFFNRPVTQVNVQNNYDQNGNHKYSDWLADTPQEAE